MSDPTPPTGGTIPGGEEPFTRPDDEFVRLERERLEREATEEQRLADASADDQHDAERARREAAQREATVREPVGDNLRRLEDERERTPSPEDIARAALTLEDTGTPAATDETTHQTPGDEAGERVTDAIAAQEAQGFSGVKVDPTPNENYTFGGRSKGAPTPETSSSARIVADAALRNPDQRDSLPTIPTADDLSKEDRPDA